MTQFFIGVKAIIEKYNKILLLKRSEKYGLLEGQWDIPGGRIEFGEEPEAGLQREVKEETGLKIEGIKEILDVSTVFKNEEKQIVRITYLCTVKEGEELISNEHTDMQWIEKEKIRNLEFKDEILKKTITRTYCNEDTANLSSRDYEIRPNKFRYDLISK